MLDNELKATHKRILHIGDMAIPCYVLKDGRRVISGRGLTLAIGMKGRGSGVIRIPTHPTLGEYMSEELKFALSHPLTFIGSGSPKNNPAAGYEATMLHSLCEVILSAQDAGVLKTEQEQRYAKAASVLMRAFAKVGIIALVDEATGYQAERDRSELQKILSAYIAEELLPWTKRFPDEFYIQLFRLRGWQYQPLNVKRPQYVGRLTNELVYQKLPPGVLDELRLKNPTDEHGRRKHKHHQFLTDDIGNPHLEKHLAVVITLMKISPTWTIFERHLNRAFPTSNVQLQLWKDEEDVE